jgi:nitrogen-specific signal transduction histidine kinase
VTTPTALTADEFPSDRLVDSAATVWLDALVDGYLLADRDLAILYLNPAFAKVLGQSASNLVGRRLPDAVPSGSDSLYCRAALAALKAGRWHEVDEPSEDSCYRVRAVPTLNGVMLIRADVTAPQRGPARESSSRTKGANGVATDDADSQPSARDGTHEQFLLKQKRESLGVLAGGVAHDFNNLLSAIVGSAGLLLRELPEGSSSYESATLIKKAAERAGEFTRKLLIYAGKAIASRRPLDISELLRINLIDLTAACPRGAVLETRLAVGLPFVQADASLLHQVVMHLVVNAIEATATIPARVMLATGLEEHENRHMVYVEVSDEGSGIASEIRHRIFDPYFTTKGRGRGFGLSTVQGIVHVHGGQIRFSSAPGKGTTIRILLPTVDDRPATGEASALVVSQSRGPYSAQKSVPHSS